MLDKLCISIFYMKKICILNKQLHILGCMLFRFLANDDDNIVVMSVKCLLKKYEASELVSTFEHKGWNSWKQQAWLCPKVIKFWEAFTSGTWARIWVHLTTKSSLFNWCEHWEPYSGTYPGIVHWSMPESSWVGGLEYGSCVLGYRLQQVWKQLFHPCSSLWVKLQRHFSTPPISS